METLAYKIAAGLKSRAPGHPASMEVLAFSMLAIINTVSTIILALLIALATGMVAETAAALASFALLRAISGGLHLKHGWACAVATSVTANLIVFVHYPNVLIYGITAVSAILAFIFAPSRIEHQTRIPTRYFPYLKLAAVLLISLNLFVLSSIIASAWLIQCLLLIRRR
ncbi:accessory gene regulator B family protein [Paenibacillus sambharensis]|nr:accessory gene regulator B family protein [Paenibacillus sambharensis]